MNTSSEVAEISLASWPPSLTDENLPALAGALTDFIAGRRWYRSKARRIRNGRVRDVIPLPAAGCCIVIMTLEFTEGDAVTYLCTLAADARDPGGDAIARLSLRDGTRLVLREAVGDPALSGALLDAIAGSRSFRGASGRISASHTSAWNELAPEDPTSLPARVSTAEQSNSTIFYGDRLLLKLFRKLEPGANPDVEIAAFLGARGFRHTPALAGQIEYSPNSGEPMSAGILQQFVPNQGDAWEWTLEQARDFFAQERDLPPKADLSSHLWEAASSAEDADAARNIGAYLESARLLGRRTAEMHIALTPDTADDAFLPEPFTAEMREALHRSLLDQIRSTTALIRERQTNLPIDTAAAAERVLSLEPEIRARFEGLRHASIDALRIRHHGDYHLGQVLVTADDFMIIDFEGEPGRPLEERRRKGIAMRDVAGMIRSFQYAAYSALPEGAPPTLADYWTATVSRAFVTSYRKVAEGHRFLPADPAQCRLLLDAFTMEKALYEIAYELNNRPDWVRIPLAGILSLMN